MEKSCVQKNGFYTSCTPYCWVFKMGMYTPNVFCESFTVEASPEGSSIEAAANRAIGSPFLSVTIKGR